MSAEVIEVINAARTDPSGYAQSLRDYRRLFRGRVVNETGEGPGVMTFEGVDAVDEAIVFLERMRPTGPLTPNAILAGAAGDHVEDQGPSGATGHRGADGSMPPQRIQRHGRWSGSVAETISYGAGTADGVVRQLIVDDGVPNRAHRHTLFDPELRMAGVACGPHRIYVKMCVIDFAVSASQAAATANNR